ncbi:6-phosphogluconolactonase [Rhodococcus sp. RD6.2]|jgi:6-phosphogluconolactonase|uniref:6-phosphogluconolactonase n=1 Tax=Rhodococcus sp. RD6.2 TaxID=260936 RepID=UPI00063B4DDF|nr:6-phosphogluconolactonase [Rhodococcus sp. RD6.2]CRK52878.1 6-phosphogluconolactonase [Rhodococcus sp. RD6.2]
MTDSVTVQTYDDSAALIEAAAAKLIDVIVDAQSERGVASVVLTGGGNGIGVLRALRADSGKVDWSKVEVFWGDERFVPAGHPDRNEVQAHEALLDHVPVDPARLHPMPYGDGAYAGDPDAAAHAYEHLLAAHAGDGPIPDFDIHLLGMGGEGHVNSLFPDTDAVREETRFVVGVTDSPKPPAQRVTLTLPAVRRARRVWLLVAGADKAEAVAAAVGGADPVDIPSAGAIGAEETVWFLDRAAAANLPD